MNCPFKKSEFETFLQFCRCFYVQYVFSFSLKDSQPAVPESAHVHQAFSFTSWPPRTKACWCVSNTTGDRWLSTRLHWHTSLPPPNPSRLPRPSPAQPLASFRVKRSRSIPETDQCPWLGCCIRLFDEVAAIKRQLVRGGGGDAADSPSSERAANGETAVMSEQRAIVLMNENQCCNKYRM